MSRRQTESIEVLAEKIKKKRDFPPPGVRRRLRESAGLTQQDFAGFLGVDRASVSRYETDTRAPSGEILSRYIRLLNRLTIELSGKAHEN